MIYINGGMLTGSKIKEEFYNGNILCDHFNETRINPNSYNLLIGKTYKMLSNYYYSSKNPIDLKEEIKYTDTITLEDSGLILLPNYLYLIPTYEALGSNHYVIMITGRSSAGRVGLSVHHEAGFGDIGYYGKWTLQVSVMFPTKIYPMMPLAQAYFITPTGDTNIKYHGKYQNSDGAVGSQIYKDFI